MSRKKGVIENPEWDEEVKNEANLSSSQDDNIQKSIDEMYKKLNSTSSEQTTIDDNKLTETPAFTEETEQVKTLWDIVMESAEDESEYEDETPKIIEFLKKAINIMKKGTIIALKFLKKYINKMTVWIKLFISNQIKKKKENKKNNPQSIQRSNKVSKPKKIKSFKSPTKKDNSNETIVEKRVIEDEELYPIIKKGSATSEIAFIGTNKGSGTTYTAFMCASALSKKYKVCVLEQNNSNHFSSIFEYLNSEIPYQRKMFRHNNIDYYFNLSYDKFVEEFRTKYDFIIVDYSSIEEIEDYVQIARSDKIFAIIDGTYWRINDLVKIIPQLKVRDKAKAIIYLNPIREPIADIKKLCFPNQVVKVPFTINPFKVDKETSTLFYKLLKIRYK